MNPLLNRTIAFIPARYASTRFPGKPLAMMDGKPMIERVYQRVASVVPHTYVATDDSRIYEAVIAFGGRAVMTSPHHKSGTDRCYEAYRNVGATHPYVLNIQGDEPFVTAQQIEALVACFAHPDTELATLVKPFTTSDGWEALANVNSPKVVLNSRQEAIYFSRSIIPYRRGVEQREWIEAHTYYKHIGMYGYRADLLEQITQLAQSPLEIAESLEQLRWLEQGYRIKVGITQQESIGIDTPEDMERALRFMQQQNQPQL